ncbi:Fic family protein [Streptomyces sp. NBC_00669]|uniref:Fic family protein n=1 Tax=Streptomyces sp. NBC_00669 TaxID=2976011 RepID=UPI002E339ABD|nr:Fic family protein [Streptomyces sp. NBC_00669]
MVSTFNPGLLTWDDVDPARHPFDSRSAARVVHALGPARRVPHRPDVPFRDPEHVAWSWHEARLWADAMSHALAEHYGDWAVGWRWSRDEGDFDGGPVSHWCCPRDSVTTPQETLDRVVAALCEWRAWLESLADRFAVYPLELADIENQRVLWESVSRNLILQVVDRTGCGSGWYGHCRQVLTWFLSRAAVAPDIAQRLVDQAIGGRFNSWTGPDTLLVNDIVEKLALSVRPEDAAPPVRRLPDHLERWLAVRATVPWDQDPGGGGEGPVAPPRDGAAEDVRAFDGALDPARAEGLLIALELVRADAARGAVLDFALLRGWHRHVLGTPAGSPPPAFRTLPAFAKEGRERYGIGPDTRARFDACLAESARGDGQDLAPAARAARAYLDVCFFHPFDDGNARCAFLVLVFVLAREGVTLGSVSLIRRVVRWADRPEDAYLLARYIGHHISDARRLAAAGH